MVAGWIKRVERTAGPRNFLPEGRRYFMSVGRSTQLSGRLLPLGAEIYRWMQPLSAECGGLPSGAAVYR